MADPKPRQPDQRFRSFAERFLVTRSSLFRNDPDGLAADTWACVMDAQRAYKMIRMVALGKFEDAEGNDDGIF